jgi:hypothetical protein
MFTVILVGISKYKSVWLALPVPEKKVQMLLPQTDNTPF